MISFVFHKAHLGCPVEKGLNEIIHIRAFALDLDCSKCSENTIQLLLLICYLPGAWWEWMAAQQRGLSCFLSLTKGQGGSRFIGQAWLSLAGFHI